MRPWTMKRLFLGFPLLLLALGACQSAPGENPRAAVAGVNVRSEGACSAP